LIHQELSERFHVRHRGTSEQTHGLTGDAASSSVGNGGAHRLRCGGRVVSAAGRGLAHREVAYDNLNAEKKDSMLGAPLQSSVANDLLGFEVNRRQQAVRMSVDGPGMVKGTNLAAGLSAQMFIAP
jgi:hypothetical protein